MKYSNWLQVFAADVQADRRYELPIPPTLNHYLGYNGKNRYYTAEAKKFRAQMLETLVAQDHANEWFSGPLKGYIGIELTFTISNYRSFDIDNRQKVLFDAMQQKEYKIFPNDNAIQAIYVQKFVEKIDISDEWVMMYIYTGERFGLTDPRENSPKKRRK